ncbi:hypothetical protein Maes01_02779 [Microbulbifer aestuariivivens]|uniref:Uncharacterized protein n=1 Tax=Microbulbifer aestuariivivens TaxID=1908308 RepID=A0ABP9WSS3_9GAMM
MNIGLLGQNVGLALCNAFYIGEKTPEDELLVPFGIFFTENETNMVPFEANSQAEAIEMGRNVIAHNEEHWSGWCYGREGLVNLEDGSKHDAFIFEAKLKDMSKPLILIQLFEYPFRLSGKLIVNMPSELNNVFVQNRGLFVNSLHDGARSHKQGGPSWEKWEQLV